MAGPILSLSGDEIETLRKSVLKMSILPYEVVINAFKHPDITSILEMFWLVKIAPPKLNSLNGSEDFDYIERNNGAKFFKLVTFPEEDKEKILHFKDLVTTLEYFKVYRDIVLPANGTGRGRSGNVSDGLNNNAAPTHQGKENIGKEGSTKGGSHGRQKDGNTRVSDNMQEQQPGDDQGHRNGRGGQGQRDGHFGHGQEDDDEPSRLLDDPEQGINTRIQNTGQGDGGGRSSLGPNDRTSADGRHGDGGARPNDRTSADGGQGDGGAGPNDRTGADGRQGDGGPGPNDRTGADGRQGDGGAGLNDRTGADGRQGDGGGRSSAGPNDRIGADGRQGDGGGAGLNDRTSADAGHKEKPTTSGTLFKEGRTLFICLFM